MNESWFSPMNDEHFCIDLDDVWSQIGYSKKQEAKDKLTKNPKIFRETLDYKKGHHQRRFEKFWLTLDCYEKLKQHKSSYNQLHQKTIEELIQNEKLVLSKDTRKIPPGEIDILTVTEVIEVKDAEKWKHAVGQVSIYKNYYPEREARIHLYGEANKPFKNLVEENCQKLNIKVSWHQPE